MSNTSMEYRKFIKSQHFVLIPTHNSPIMLPKSASLTWFHLLNIQLQLLLLPQTRKYKILSLSSFLHIFDIHWQLIFLVYRLHSTINIIVPLQTLNNIQFRFKQFRWLILFCIINTKTCEFLLFDVSSPPCLTDHQYNVQREFVHLTDHNQLITVTNTCISIQIKFVETIIFL